MLDVLLQLRSPSSDPVIALTVVLLTLLSISLSVGIALVLLRGYRRGPGHPGMLYLALGLILLTTVPELLRVGLPTLTGVGTVGRSVLVSGSELTGLGVILWVVYGGGSQ
ncbi:hypothetical protein ACFQL0_15935 [Haloplanus litoreus]|uniref:hypothetical protein n=1 Tax=Haloplanus litoreus TaxID=767515 RepID=UPI00361C2363